jgi:hypothetical protein
MEIVSIQCHNDCCRNELKVCADDSGNIPLVFCSEGCLSGFIRLENQQLEPQESDRINKLVHDIVGESKRIQEEFENMRRVRQGYFDMFSGLNLKEEIYTRDWAFKRESSK